MGGKGCSEAIDRRIAALADAQHGVVARRQLVAAGIGPRAIERRAAARRLIPLHRGVYAVGHRRLTRAGTWLAAVLAVGDGAALSHRDAAALHGLGEWTVAAIEVTTARAARAPRRIRVYRRRVLAPDDVTTVDGIPVTTVERTLVDLAGVVGRDRLAHALNEAERRRALDWDALAAARARVRQRNGRGHAVLTAVLAEHERRGAQLTRSELEIAFRRLVRAHALPEPELNARLAGYEVDALWRAERLVVECDGWEAHRDRVAFGRDRAKGNALLLRGYALLRFTHDDIVRRPARVAAAIRTALAR